MAATLTWLGQGGYLISSGNTKVAIDPYLSDMIQQQGGPARLLPAPLSAHDLTDLWIIATHDHGDHFDTDTLTNTDFSTCTYAGPTSCTDHFKAIGIPPSRILPLDIGDQITLGDLHIQAVFADHTPDSIGLMITLEGIKVYFTADSLYNENLLQSGKGADLLIVCINGRWGNMSHLEAASLAKDLGVRAAIPSHYGLFAENTADPNDFVTAMQGCPCVVSLLTHGKPTPLQDLLRGVS